MCDPLVIIEMRKQQKQREHTIYDNREIIKGMSWWLDSRCLCIRNQQHEHFRIRISYQGNIRFFLI